MKLINFFSMKSLFVTIQVFTLIIIYLICFSATAQEDIPYFVDPNPGDEAWAAPSVSQFQTYKFVPVNLYTGRINVDIPIYDINVGNIKIPIQLAYNSGGIKVEEAASNVGMGWNLIAGGNIVKVVKDIDDSSFFSSTYAWMDESGDNAGGHTTTLHSAGYHHRSRNNDYADKVDSSPDLFRVAAPGLQNSFYLEEHNKDNFDIPYKNKLYDAKFIDNTGIKGGEFSRKKIVAEWIHFSSEDDGVLSSSVSHNPHDTIFAFNDFKLINEDGLVYDFGYKDIIETYQQPVLGFFGFITNYDRKVTSWNLNTIVDPSSNETVNFNYLQYQKTQPESIRNYTNTKMSTFGFSRDFNTYFHAQFTRIGSEYKFLSVSGLLTKYTRLNRLKTINWSEGSVEFIYNLDRVDYLDEKALTQIVVKNNYGKIIKNVNFTYSYRNSKENCPKADCKRLFLEEVIFLNSKNISEYKYILDYNDKPLPRRFSLERDYLGYYNNNGVNKIFTNYLESNLSPTLYFYPNQGEYSILPFKRKDFNATFRTIPGDYSLVPSKDSDAGMLSKITYPTGGSTSFEFENNTFSFYGHNYVSGGIRIKKQILEDENGGIREYHYNYDLPNGLSSGAFNNIPVFGYPNTDGIDLNADSELWLEYFTRFDKSKLGYELTNGSFLGYSCVREFELGNGYREYKYSNPNEYKNQSEDKILTNPYSIDYFEYLFNNSAYPGIHYLDKDILRGRVKSVKTYDSQENLLKEELNNYTHKVFDSISLMYPVSMPFDLYLRGGPGENVKGFTPTSKINIERNLITKKVINEYFGNKVINTVQEYKYDDKESLLKEFTNFDSNQRKIKKQFIYVNDFKNSGNEILASLIDENRISELIEEKESIDDEVIFNSKLTYDNYSGLIAPRKIAKKKAGNSLETYFEYHKYDSFGNPLEVSQADGSHIVYLWGYSQQHPIAKIENATYQEVADALNVTPAILETYTESKLLVINDLRVDLPQAMVTTYTYAPLIGVTSITDPKGLKSTYDYDNYNRLKFIKDGDGNILKEYKYNYKNQ